MTLSQTERVGRGLDLWRLRVSRVAALGPTTVITALASILVLLEHRLSVGRGTGSLLAARPVQEPRPRRPAHAEAVTVPRAP